MYRLNLILLFFKLFRNSSLLILLERSGFTNILTELKADWNYGKGRLANENSKCQYNSDISPSGLWFFSFSKFTYCHFNLNYIMPFQFAPLELEHHYFPYGCMTILFKTL